MRRNAHEQLFVCTFNLLSGLVTESGAEPSTGCLTCGNEIQEIGSALMLTNKGHLVFNRDIPQGAPKAHGTNGDKYELNKRTTYIASTHGTESEERKRSVLVGKSERRQ